MATHTIIGVIVLKVRFLKPLWILDAFVPLLHPPR